MTCQSPTTCDRCGVTIRRGQPIVLVRGWWLHLGCSHSARVRPYVAGVAA